MNRNLKRFEEFNENDQYFSGGYQPTDDLDVSNPPKGDNPDYLIDNDLDELVDLITTKSVSISIPDDKEKSVMILFETPESAKEFYDIIYKYMS